MTNPEAPEQGQPEVNDTPIITNTQNYVCAKFSSIKSTETINFYIWEQLIELANSPQNVEKNKSIVIAPQLSGYKTKEKVLAHDQMTMCSIDIDTGNVTIDAIKEGLATLDIESYIIHSSKSATASDKKWRVLLELKAPIIIKDWVLFQTVLANLLDGDAAVCRPTQVLYVPNKGDHYEVYISEGIALGSENKVFMDACTALIDDDKKTHKKQEKKASVTITKNRTGNKVSIDGFTIEKANKHLDTAMLLMEYGYEPCGRNKWLSPNATSGNPGLILFDTGRWYSHHSSDKDIGCSDGHDIYGDAFDLMAHYKYDGDAAKCLQELANKYDSKGQKQRRKAHATGTGNDGIPNCFVYDKTLGVFTAGTKDRDSERVTRNPIKVIARSCDSNNSNWSSLIEWIDDKKGEHRQIISNELFYKKQELISLLAREGIQIDYGMENDLIKYLSNSEPSKHIINTSKTGWLNNAFVLPTETLKEDPTNVINYDVGAGSYQGALYVQGNIDTWKTGINNVSELVRIALYASFSAPLLTPCNVESSILHISGGTSGGKTTAIQIAASVWGCGAEIKEKRAYIQSWNSTTNALEGIAESHNDLPLIFDEVGVKDASDFGSIVYTLITGKGKSRAEKSGKLQKDNASWKCLIFSTGEKPIAKHIESGGKEVKGGQSARCIDILKSEFEDITRSAKEANQLKELASSCFGVPGRKFIEFLGSTQESYDEWKAFDKELIGQAPNPLSERVRDKMAHILFAGLLAVRAGVLPFTEQQVIEDLSKLFAVWVSHIDEMDDIAKTSNKILNLCLSDMARFQEADENGEKHPPNRMLGYRSDNIYDFIPAEFEKLCGDNDHKEVKKYMHENGHLISPTKSGKFRYSGGVRLPFFPKHNAVRIELKSENVDDDFDDIFSSKLGSYKNSVDSVVSVDTIPEIQKKQGVEKSTLKIMWTG